MRTIVTVIANTYQAFSLPGSIRKILDVSYNGGQLEAAIEVETGLHTSYTLTQLWIGQVNDDLQHFASVRPFMGEGIQTSATHFYYRRVS